MYSLLGPALFASLVAAHGHITNIVINGVSFNGWDINSYPYTESPPAVVAWGTPNTGNGFIAPDAYTTSDIICHLNATNAKGHAVVAAGDRVFLQWTDWPESHHGPVVDYLASCGSTGCETVDKTTLKFFKIDGVGLVDDTTVPGTWGDDQLVAQDSGWMVEIPPDIAPGHYVLRHELIALHSAGTEGGAQNYPQCFNLQITGSGSKQPAGVLGTDLYRPTDPGILVNIYTSLSTYVRDQSSGFADTSPGSTPLLMSLYQIVPGPTLYSGAVSITQTTSASTASGTPVTGTGAATGGTTTTSTSKAITTTLVTTTRPTSLTTTTSKITTIRKLTTTTPSTTAAGGGGATQTLYGRCGGTGWTGATACASPAACSSSNPWYSHCVPIAA